MLVTLYSEFDLTLSQTRERARNDRAHFFKYMSSSTAELVLKNRTLRWSTPGCLNDPFDMQFDFDLAVTAADVVPEALEVLWQIYQGEREPGETKFGRLMGIARAAQQKKTKDEFSADWGSALEQSFRNMKDELPALNRGLKEQALTAKVLCLTERPDNANMWNFYAEQHKGVVLRFRSIPAFDSAFMMAQRVNYSKHAPQIAEKQEIVDFLTGLRRLDKLRVLHQLIFTKTEDWAHEREWRIFSGDGRNKTTAPEDIRFFANELDGLIFGKDCPSAMREKLAQLASRYPNVALYEARNVGGFGLQIHTSNQ
ncbi:DUF2971 domain-containing protein [Rhizobium sp. YS-1r]|uniref:DUF2971 domain-containing protein n=1 Tax=Rhizobium sp. YS-1r TaxID=1532558 RepID=UPI00051058BC|nr:DUF2971 domain-containing protein [Rhizobium sp. YS-1r]KGE01012.1 hypothetical protein JL39_07680 [Rhizobium sp. YS-1r]